MGGKSNQKETRERGGERKQSTLVVFSDNLRAIQVHIRRQVQDMSLSPAALHDFARVRLVFFDPRVNPVETHVVVDVEVKQRAGFA